MTRRTDPSPPQDTATMLERALVDIDAHIDEQAQLQGPPPLEEILRDAGLSRLVAVLGDTAAAAAEITAAEADPVDDPVESTSAGVDHREDDDPGADHHDSPLFAMCTATYAAILGGLRAAFDEVASSNPRTLLLSATSRLQLPDVGIDLRPAPFLAAKVCDLTLTRTVAELAAPLKRIASEVLEAANAPENGVAIVVLFGRTNDEPHSAFLGLVEGGAAARAGTETDHDEGAALHWTHGEVPLTFHVQVKKLPPMTNKGRQRDRAVDPEGSPPRRGDVVAVPGRRRTVHVANRDHSGWIMDVRDEWSDGDVVLPFPAPGTSGRQGGDGRRW